ncbi:hypothetical protein EVAR_22214_1 [Eumeta japonica]|uniref:Uncharacterized protein n=1 Tax=Eumeta variegata TaxID=151549 RepID=A0A4C1UBN4_EUMVA|nr:hypothetical protein EVAR_22214_1 [Eumeta japonica]
MAEVQVAAGRCHGARFGADGSRRAADGGNMAMVRKDGWMAWKGSKRWMKEMVEGDGRMAGIKARKYEIMTKCDGGGQIGGTIYGMDKGNGMAA